MLHIRRLTAFRRGLCLVARSSDDQIALEDETISRLRICQMTTRLFHISDVHFGVEDRSALHAVARAVAEEQPDAVVCTGDLTQRAKRSEYAAAAEWLGSLNVPVWVDPGNHDMPYYNLFERFLNPFGRFHGLKEGVAASAFETNDVVLIPLNTSVPAQTRWPWSDGVVTPSAIEQTLGRLRQLKEDPRWKIVTAHHPLHGPQPGGPSSTIGGVDALGALVGEGMDAIMTGHIHTPFNERREIGSASAQVIGAGTLSTRLRHGAPPSYNVLTCQLDPIRDYDITVELRELPPSSW